MARDVRMYGDEQIDYWLSQPNTPPELRAELMAEKRRRANPTPPNVEANLEASAAPLPPDPAIAARAEGRRQQAAYNQSMGTPYVRGESGKIEPIVPEVQDTPSPLDPNDPSTWEAGYEDYVQRNTPAEPTNSVERVDRYLAQSRNPERFQLEGRDEFMGRMSADYTRARAAAEQEKFGYGLPREQVTADQQTERLKQADSDAHVRYNRLDSIIDRIASTTGTPRAQVRASFATAGTDGTDALADYRLTPQEVEAASRQFRYAAKDEADAELAERRKFLRRRGMMAGSNLRANAANNWTDMPADWQNFVRAGGKGATPLDVEARQLQQAAAWAGQAVTGALANGGQNGIVGEQWAAKRRGDAVARARELAAEKGNKLTVADRDRIARQVEAEFPGHGQAAVDALDVQEPLPLPEGHGNPGRVPEGHG